MDLIESERVTAKDVVSIARERGVNLEPLLNDIVFEVDWRWVFVWRKQDGVPSTGRPDELDGTLRYNMQGAVSGLPSHLKPSDVAFHGVWCETGSFESVEQAFEFVRAWLIDRKEVDDLPSRCIRSWGV